MAKRRNKVPIPKPLNTDAYLKAKIWAKTMSEYEVEHNVLERVLKAARSLSIPPYPTKEKGTPVVYTLAFKQLYHSINTSHDIQRYRARALPRWHAQYLEEGYAMFNKEQSNEDSTP